MSDRIPLPYTKRVLELFRNPKNLGKMEDADASATAGSLACGDMITVYLKVDGESQRILDASFESYGCAANIAASSTLTEIVKGKKLEEAWKISWKDISDELGGLPAVKYHCGILAVGAFRRTMREYFKNRERPSWLPEELTPDEKHALEEEKLMEILQRKVASGSLPSTC